MTRRYLESQEQRLFVQRWRLDPRTRDLPACAIPNAGARGKTAGGIMKAEGMSRGVPDWLCFEPAKFVHQVEPRAAGLALEFKSPAGRGRLTPEQAEWHRQLRSVGWRVEVVTSALEAWATLCAHLGIAP